MRIKTDNPVTVDAMTIDAAFKKLPREVLAKIFCELICHRWPVECPIDKPVWFDRLSKSQKSVRPELVMMQSAILRITARYDRSRAWHMLGYDLNKKTEEQFVSWWSTHGAEIY